MIVKAKSPTPIKPIPVCGQSGNKVVQPIRCTSGGELMVYQVNEPGTVGDGVNRKNKDGVLTLGDDGHYLRNVRVDPDGTTVVRHDGPIDVTLKELSVQGSVTVDNTLTVNPVRVSNMPDHIQIQENLHVVQTPMEAQVAPFSFDGYGVVVISQRCKIYSIYITVCEPTLMEIVGITGEIRTKEFKISLFPQFIQMDKVEFKVREYVHGGGYIIYENC
jgi:hypothetical protein